MALKAAGTLGHGWVRRAYLALKGKDWIHQGQGETWRQEVS